MPSNDAVLIQYDELPPFVEIYPNYDVSKLPSWLQDNIASARVYGNSKKGVLLPDGRKYHLDNVLNDLTGRDWTLFINSVFCTRYPTNGKESYAHHIRKVHPTPKPPQLMRDLISFFTKEGDYVFDPFAGVGGTLLGAGLCSRAAAGIELNEAYISAYSAAAEELGLPIFPVLHGDCLSILNDAETMKSITAGKEISLLLMDPPYSNMMSREKTGAEMIAHGKAATPFSGSDRDLGNMTRTDFLAALRKTTELTLPYIKRRGYVVVFIKDLQPSKKETNLLHAEVVDCLNQIPTLYYKGMKIWADESAKMYPYGYPFCFVANQIHQYILIFRKEK